MDRCPQSYFSEQQKLKDTILSYNDFAQTIHTLNQELKDKTGNIKCIIQRPNEIEIYQNTFNQYLASTALSSATLEKPLCVYAVSKKNDKNGAVLSQNMLNLIMYDIKNVYQPHYRVVPILFDNKNDLNKELFKHKNISLLIFNSHGTSQNIGNITIENNLKFHNISVNSQIILHACKTASGTIVNSIAYKIAKENKCEVFAAQDNVNCNIKFTIENNRVRDVSFYDRYNPAKSYRIYIEEQRTQSQSQINMQ